MDFLIFEILFSNIKKQPRIFFSRRGLFIKWPTFFLLENIGRPPEKKKKENIGSTLVSSRKYLNYTKKLVHLIITKLSRRRIMTLGKHLMDSYTCRVYLTWDFDAFSFFLDDVSSNINWDRGSNFSSEISTPRDHLMLPGFFGCRQPWGRYNKIKRETTALY